MKPKSLLRFFLATAVTYFSTVIVEEIAAQVISDGFNYPVGPRIPGFVTPLNDGDGWKNDQDFCELNLNFGGLHPAEDWNGEGGGNTDIDSTVYAVSHGEVTVIEDKGAIGEVLALKHSLPDGTTIYSVYLHITVNPSLKVGSQVSRDDQIGKIADISSSGFFAHLHFELRTKAVMSGPGNLYQNDLDNGYYASLAKLQADGFTIDPSDFIDTHRSPLVLPSGWNPIITGLTNLNVRSTAINPGNSNILYAGTSGGVFKSMDGGKSWSFSGNGFIDLRIQDLVIDPQNTSTLYAGTVGGGVHKSNDAADTWIPINTGLPTLFVPAVAVHLQNSSIVYCGPDAFGIYRSINGGNAWSRVGAFRDTRSFALDPANPAIAYAATVFSVRKTTNDGASWFFSGSGLPSSFMNGLAIDPLNTSTAYSGPHQNGVWKTTNGGSSWFASKNGMPSGVTVLALAVNPTSPNIIYAGTVVAGVFKSTDGGNNWVSFNDGLTNLNIGQNTLAIDPTNPATVYVGTGGGGIFKLEPGGSINTTPPVTCITAAVDGNEAPVPIDESTVSSAITFTFTGMDNVGVAGFECSLDGATFSACTSPQSFTGLAVGSHIYQVQATNVSGNTDPTPAKFAWTILTPAQATQNVIDDVDELVTSSVLTQGQGNALTATLNAAHQQLNQGNTAAAINQLQAFINQVNAFISSGVLSPAEGQPLIDEANNIISELTGSSKLTVNGQTETSSLPKDFALEQNYPNPFNPETEIRFQLPKTSHVMLRIFNTLGQEIRTLADKQYEAGFHSVRWDGRDSNGNVVSSGIYLYQLQMGTFSQVKKMTLLR